MAITPRSVTSSPPASTSSVRQVAVSRVQSAVDGAPVEETSAQTNVSFDTAMLFQNQEQTGDQKEDSSNSKTLIDYASSNQAFASILEETSTAVQAGGLREGSRRGFSGYVAKAINVYEENARVIHGTGPDRRGSTLSLNL